MSEPSTWFRRHGRLLVGFGAVLLMLALCSCPVTRVDPATVSEQAVATGNRPAADDDRYLAARRRMVRTLREGYGIDDEVVLRAMQAVPRHRFVPDEQRAHAYEDRPLGIGHAQTISQPFIVAAMTAAAGIDQHSKVLEIGTGSGYQAAVLAEISDQVWSIEIVAPLGERAAAVLAELGYDQVLLRIGDGYQGWPEAAPFDAIVVTAAPDHVPEPLQQQLEVGGRLVMPVGDYFQELIVITRGADGFERERLMGVRFVPMTGEAEQR